MSFPRYPKYKDSGVEWLGDVPEHWDVKRLCFVTEINPSKSETSHLDRALPVSFLPMEAVGDDGTLDLERTKPVGEVESGYTYFRDGDVTVAKITPCFENGKGAIMRGLTNNVGFGTTELIVARPLSGRITSEFLGAIFRSAEFRLLGEATMYGAGGQKRVPDSFIRNFTTTIPQIPEQTAIAAFLDRETAKIDALVAEQRRLIELLKEKRQAVISHAVTKGLNPAAPMKPSGIDWLGDTLLHWKATPLKRIASIRYGIGEPPPYREEGTPLIRATNIHAGELFSEGLVYVDPSDIPEKRIVWLDPGDIIVVRSGAYTGDSAIVPHGFGPAIAGFDMVLRCTGCDPHFVQFALLSYYLKEGQIDLEKMRAAQPHLNAEELGTSTLLLPPQREQREIVTFLEGQRAELDTLTAEAERAIDLLQERRTALISAAVTGKIDVRDFAKSEAA